MKEKRLTREDVRQRIKEAFELYDMMDKIVSTYNRTKSIRATAATCGVWHGTVKKVLIDAGVIIDQLTEKILSMEKKGMTRKEISDALGIGESAVSTHVGYGNRCYIKEDKTKNAMRIKEWREKNGYR